MSKNPVLQVMVGPAGTGKTQCCIDAFESALRTSNDLLADDLLFLLPTAEHRSRIMDLILRKGLPGFFYQRISTLDRILADYLKFGNCNLVSEAGRRMILASLLRRLNFKYFREAAHTPGFLELLSEFIGELKENLITKTDLQKHLHNLSQHFPDFGMKYEDLGLIFQTYEEELTARDLIDQQDSIHFLEEGIRRGELRPPRLRAVWIDGFSEFSRMQFGFLQFLSRHSQTVTVTLTADAGADRRELFSSVHETQMALERFGFVSVDSAAGSPRRTKRIKNFRTSKRALIHLERNLFSTAPFTEVVPDASLEILEASSMINEVEMIARKIKNLVLRRGYHFSDIAVLFRNVGPYVSVIENICRQYNIPVEIHERMKLRNSPVARTLRSFLELLLHDWKRKDLFNFLKSSYANQNYEAVCAFELEAMGKGVFNGRAKWLETFQLDFLKNIAVWDEQFRSITQAGQFTFLLRKLLGTFRSMEGASFDERDRLDQSAFNRILLLIEELERKEAMKLTFSDETVLLDRLIVEFMALMDVDLYSIHAPDKNRVQVYSVSLARQKEYKAVFVAGLLERQFPMQMRENPLLLDFERHLLNHEREVLKERLPRQKFERYLFYLAVTRAREYLFLSCPQFDLEGNPSLPSYYVEEVRRVFKKEPNVRKQYITDVLAPWSEIVCRREAEQKTIHGLFSAGSDLAPGESRKAIEHYNDFIGDERFSNVVKRAAAVIEGRIQDVRIHPFFVPRKKIWSPTSVEEYAECSYRFFAHRILGLESQNEGIDLRRRGTLLHDVLEQFFKWKNQGCGEKEVTFDQAVHFCLSRFEELWKEGPLTGERYYKIELEKRKMQEMILQILRNEMLRQKLPLPGLIPAYFEFAFGFEWEENPLPPLTLKGKKGEILMRGKIDRIDVDPSGRYGLVIDYKTGKAFSNHAFDNGTALQLPIYLLAIQQHLQLKPLGAHLYSLSKTESRGFHHLEHLTQAGIETRKQNKLSSSEFQSKIDGAVRFAEFFIDGIESAKIDVKPRECVSYCPYSSLCRIEKWRLKHIYREIADQDRKSGLVPEFEKTSAGGGGGDEA